MLLLAQTFLTIPRLPNKPCGKKISTRMKTPYETASIQPMPT